MAWQIVMPFLLVKIKEIKKTKPKPSFLRFDQINKLECKFLFFGYLFILQCVYWSSKSQYNVLKFKKFSIRKFPYRRQDVVTFTTPLKEVIQPHVLVRLPCYDFTPVIGLTLDGSLPCGLRYRFRVLPTPMAWRAVCTRPGNAFTPTFWFGITSKFSFMWAGCSPQSELRPSFWDWLHLTVLQLFVMAIVARL